MSICMLLLLLDLGIPDYSDGLGAPPPVPPATPTTADGVDNGDSHADENDPDLLPLLDGTSALVPGILEPDLPLSAPPTPVRRVSGPDQPNEGVFCSLL